MKSTIKAPEGWRILTGGALSSFINDEFGDSGRDILAAAKPANGADGVFAIFEHQASGYIERPASNINQAFYVQKTQEDLQILNDENGFTDAEKVRWKGFALTPRYDNSKHTLDYGIELYFGRDVAVNLYRMLLIRDGALVLTLVGTPRERLSLQGWSIAPDPAIAYERYQSGRDPKAEGTLENLMLMNRFI